MDQTIINLYDDFTHSRISRREFNEKLTKLAGSAAAAAALMPLLVNDYAKAAIVPENDPALNAQRVSYDSPKGKVNGRGKRKKAPITGGRGKRPPAWSPGLPGSLS